MESSVTTPERDEQRLAELGYKQSLNRAWSGFSNFAISFTIISILAGCFTTYGQAWNNGGPIAISIGWPLISIPILIIGFCMSELVSAYPTAGGIYWWAGKLGGPVWAWFTGWFNLIGLVAVLASVDYACATFLNVVLGLYEVNILGLNFGDDAHILSETFVLFALILLVHTIVNVRDTHLLSLVNSVSVWWHVIGVAAIVIVLIFVPDGHQSFSFVFGHRINNSGFSDRHVLVLRPAARLPADPVHDHRLRRLGPHLRGDPRRLDRGGEGRLEIDLLLGGDRLGRAAGDHLRGHQRRRRPTKRSASRRRCWSKRWAPAGASSS